MRHLMAISLIALIGLISVNAQAENTLTISNGQARRGTTGNKISVDLSNEVGMIGLQFDVEYDDEVFSISDIDSTARSEHFGGGFFWNILYAGLARVMMLDLELDPLPAGTGAMAEIYFDISNAAIPGTYPLKLKNVQASDDSAGELDVTVINGTFEVTVLLDSVRIEPQSAQLACGAMRQFVAKGYDHVGPAMTLDATWTVAPSYIGQIEAGGLFTAHSQGTGMIIASYEAFADTANVTVMPGSPLSLNVGPDNLTLVSGTQQFYAVVGLDACNNSFAPTVTWAVHPSDLGTISQNGLFTAGAVGTGWIVATGSPKDSTSVTVVAGSLASITVSPDPAQTLCQGNLQFSVIGRDAHGNPIAVTPVWTVAPPALGTITANGLFTGSQVGGGWVIAMQGAMMDSALITVGAGSLAWIEIEPDEAILVSGQMRQFAATGYDACGNTVQFTPQWSVQPQTLGSISAGGLFTAHMTGEGWVFVTGSIKDSAYVFVQRGEANSLVLSPATRTIPLGQTVIYTATASDGYNTWEVTDEVMFSTSDPSGFFTNNMYTAGEPGIWMTIGTYTFDSTTLSDTASVTVNLEGVCTRGDVNCSGSDDITPGDALCAFWRSLLGYFSVECDCDCSAEASDANCDGTITPGDALCIFWRSLLGDWTQDCQCSPVTKNIGASRAVQVHCEDVGSDHVLKVRLIVAEPRHLDAFGMQLTYPADLLEFRGLNKTATTKDWTALEGQVIESGVVSIGGFHTQQMTSAGTVSLAEAVFAVKSDNARGQIDAVSLTDDLAGASVEKGRFALTALPSDYTLGQNYPNPFNPTTAIDYALPEAGNVRIEVFNTLGQVVAVVIDAMQNAGSHSVEWDASELSSGIYFYRLTAGQFTATRNMLLMK